MLHSLRCDPEDNSQTFPTSYTPHTSVYQLLTTRNYRHHTIYLLISKLN